MCEPISLGTLAAISIGSAALSAGMGIYSSVQKNNAAKADYYGKVQASQAAEQQAREDRDATHQSDVRDRAVAERKAIANQMESTLKAEEMRGKVLAQGANGSVSSAVFAQDERGIYMADQGNETSNIWNLQENARNIKARGEASFRKQAARAWQNRPGRAPTNTLIADSFTSIVKGVGSGITMYGSGVSSGLAVKTA